MWRLTDEDIINTLYGVQRHINDRDMVAARRGVQNVIVSLERERRRRALPQPPRRPWWRRLLKG